MPCWRPKPRYIDTSVSSGSSGFVDGGPGGVAASGGCGPAHDAGLGLFEFPAGGLLDAVVVAAGRGQVALAGEPGRVGDGVVQVGVAGAGAAAGRRAGRGAGPHQVLEGAAGRVPVFGGGVVAGSPGNGGEGDVQAAEERGERGGLSGVGSAAGAGFTSGGAVAAVAAAGRG